MINNKYGKSIIESIGINMNNFDTLLGQVFREIANRKLSVNITICDGFICFDFYDKDVFEIYYSEFVYMGNVEAVKKILDYMKNNETEIIYAVEYKDKIFNIKERFKNLQNAQDFCHEINCKFELNIKPEIISERIKKD